MKGLVGLLLIMLAVFGVWFLYKPNTEKFDTDRKSIEPTLPTEQFVVQHLMHDDGTIRTDFNQNKKSQTALSESIGLWMEYLVEKGDHDQFEQAFLTVKETFLMKNDLVAWKITDGRAAHTNALIDDLRIIELLFREGERTNRNNYIQAAKDLSHSVLKHNWKGSNFVDFYDVKHGYANDELTLSYLNPKALQYMVTHGVLSSEMMDNMRTFMSEIPLDDGFYPETYDFSEKSFLSEDTVNLIDQLYIAIYMEQFDVKTDKFYHWLKQTFDQEHKLYGRYDRNTKKQSVDYEAASVYALTIIYSLEKDDDELATASYEQMMTMQIQDPESIHYGGYVTSEHTHSFDNLLSLVAERKLLNEQIIQ